MTHKELASRLQELLIPDNWAGSQSDQLKHLHQGIAAIILAVEAEPLEPLVVGWARQGHLEGFRSKEDGTLLLGAVHHYEDDVLVTITEGHRDA